MDFGRTFLAADPDGHRLRVSGLRLDKSRPRTEAGRALLALKVRT